MIRIWKSVRPALAGLFVLAGAPLVAEPWGKAGPAQQPYTIVMPDRSAIPAPPCPGCLVIATLPATPMEVNGEKVSCKPWLRAVSAETVDTVVAFYDKELAAWKKSAQFGGMVHLYWKGDTEELDALDIAAVCTTVHVTVSMASGSEAPGAKTMIEINY